MLEPLPQESLSLLRGNGILDKKHEQELNQFVRCSFLRFLQQQFEEITAMKHPVLAEVALFIHRPYA
jgi:hypothetical protein